MKSSNIVIDRFRQNDPIDIDIFDRKKDIYKLFEYMDHLYIQPKDNKYDYSIFFFSGFNENAGKYVNLLKPFFENFTKVSKIKFKIILPMMKKIHRDNVTKSNYIDYNDYRYEYVYTWNVLIKDKERNYKRIGFNTFEDVDMFVQKLVKKEIKKLGSSEKIIFSGFSMGGRYMTNVLENMNINTKFNMIFKSPITIYNVKNEKNNLIKEKYELENWKYKSLDKKILEKGNYFRNKFYLFYSINDKLLTLPEGLATYEITKNEFLDVQIKIDNGRKHVVDFNCLEYFKKVLMKEIVIKKGKF